MFKKNIKDTVYKLEKNGYLLEYQIKRSNRSKNIRIEVGADEIKITAPSYMPEHLIIEYIEQKKEWIIEKYTILHQRSTSVRRDFVGGETFLYLGEPLTLLIAEDDVKRTKVFAEEKRLVVILSHQKNADEKKTEIKRVLKNWYISEAREMLTRKVEYYSNLLKVRYNNIAIKEQKTRWGSCSSKGNLNFNWKMIMAPPKIIDYIIIHELCHLIHMNHSREFWLAVEEMIDDYRERRKWLKENGYRLTW